MFQRSRFLAISGGIAIFFIVSTAIAGTGKIQGKVTCPQSSESLIGANVFLEHTTVGAMTNDKGEFVILNAPEGKHRVVASMMGYKAGRKDVDVKAGEVITLAFGLKETILELGAVVVTGTRTPHVYEDMPVRTEVIPRKLIEQIEAVNLGEALCLQTGVRVENDCNNCNFSQVRIHGLDGKYSQILIDGDPVVSSLAGVYGLEHFQEEMIGQIEVVKGGGSALYGGGAVAGTINLITRHPAMNQVRMKYLGQSTDGAGDNEISLVVERVNEYATSGVYVFGSTRQRNPYDYNDDGFSELGLLKNQSMGFNWYHKPFQTGQMEAHFHYINEERRGGNKFDRPKHEAEISEALSHNRWGGTMRWEHRLSPLFDYRVYYSLALQYRKSYYGGLGGNTATDSLEALGFYGSTDNPLHVGGMQANYAYGRHLLSGGLEYKSDKLLDKSTKDPAYYIDETYTNSGIYVQDNLRFGDMDQLEFVAGVRMDKHSELTNPIYSPRVSGKFTAGRGFTLRGTISTGFKAPQTFDEDLHLCGLEGDQRVIRNSEALKEEKSRSISGGIEYQGELGEVPLVMSVSGFFTTISDVFTEEYVGNINDLEVWRRVNSEGAKVSGVEFDVGMRPLSDVEMRGGLTIKQSEYDEPLEDFDTKNFLRTPDVYGHLRISVDATSNLNLFATGNFTGKADVPHEIAVAGQEDPDLVLERSDSFFELDLGFSYRIPMFGYSAGSETGTRISLGVKNVTDAYQSDLDKGPDRDPAYVYGPSQPRTLYTGLEISF